MGMIQFVVFQSIQQERLDGVVRSDNPVSRSLVFDSSPSLEQMSEFCEHFHGLYTVDVGRFPPSS